jgi:hypothetical protein
MDKQNLNGGLKMAQEVVRQPQNDRAKKPNNPDQREDEMLRCIFGYKYPEQMRGE